jgi:hypothetical protein
VFTYRIAWVHLTVDYFVFKKINDIWDKNNNTFVDNQTMFNRLDDKRNWISEWAKIKKSIPENVNLVQYIPNWYPVKFLFIKCIPFELTFWRDWFTYLFWDILQFQLFWNNDFIMISNIQITIYFKQSIIQFQWKCLHNIVYSEYRLQKMGKSNGQCHFYKNKIESLMAFVLQVS